MTGFLSVEAGSRGACASLLLYSALTTHLAIAAPEYALLCRYMLARRRARVHPAARRGAHVSRGPHLRCIAFHATQDCTDSGCAHRRCWPHAYRSRPSSAAG
ncbi:hypothetical protein B0H14DRAFT_1466646 [Mycena olivaceomarginata]|nr:hypothetical protein B0H14DRAFT_1466646 [Mycena olivaceomarginata]